MEHHFIEDIGMIPTICTRALYIKLQEEHIIDLCESYVDDSLIAEDSKFDKLMEQTLTQFSQNPEPMTILIT